MVEKQCGRVVHLTKNPKSTESMYKTDFTSNPFSLLTQFLSISLEYIDEKYDKMPVYYLCVSGEYVGADKQASRS